MKCGIPTALRWTAALLWIAPGLALANNPACYGETVEVIFPKTVARGNYFPAVQMLLPSPDAWLLEGLDGKTIDEHLCLPEPIEILTATMMGADPKLGHVEIVPDDPDGRSSVQLVELSRVFPEHQDIVAADQLNRYKIEESIEFPNGFLRVVGKNTDAVGGTWLFPEDYLSPIGNRIMIGCGWKICHIRYGFDADRRLAVSYRVIAWDTDVVPDWIAIDQGIRSLVQTFVEE